MNHVVELQALLALKAAWAHKEAARKHKEALLGLSQRQKLGMTSAICCDNFSAKVFRKKLVYSERKPTRRELQDVANHIVKEWKHIARRLDVNEETIARIEIDKKRRCQGTIVPNAIIPLERKQKWFSHHRMFVQSTSGRGKNGNSESSFYSRKFW